jgi:hypothetical protein
MIDHPHFTQVEAASQCYRSKASGLYVLLAQRGDQVVALPAMYTGERLPVHAEPLAWGDDEWDALDMIHAQR